MGKNISIQEGGVAKSMTADKLKTKLQGGGTCLWVPEDETQLTTKYITENGTYKASDDGYYGYSQVTVNGIGTAVGIDPTTGEPTIVYPDPTSGELQYDTLPSSIVITNPPSITNYQDGDTINFNGIIVNGCDRNGDNLGQIPFEELIFPVTVATYSSGTDADRATSDLIDETLLIKTSAHEVYGSDYADYVFRDGTGVFTCALSEERMGAYILAASKTAGSVITLTSYGGVPIPFELVNTWTYQNKTAYFHYTNSGFTVPVIRSVDPDFANGHRLTNEEVGGITKSAKRAWTMLYGDIETGGESIPVQWMRADGTILQTSFYIKVAGV